MLVSQYMLRHPHRSPGRGSFITGRSGASKGCGVMCFPLVLGIYTICSIQWRMKGFWILSMKWTCFRSMYQSAVAVVQGSILSAQTSPLQLWTRGILATEDLTALEGVCGLDEIGEVNARWHCVWSVSAMYLLIMCSRVTICQDSVV